MAITNWNSIGANIKILRENSNYTQQELAEYLGLKNHTLVSYYESGERKISLEHLNKFADLFGIELEELLNNKPEETKLNGVLAFRKDELYPGDMEIIASFNKVVKAYLKICEIEKEYEKET